jgi:hypothetical protein
MATEQILLMLIAERDRLNVAIEALGGGTTTKRPGRLRKDPLANAPDWVLPAKKKGRRTFTAAQRKAQAGKMRLYWKNKKKAEKT